MGSFKIGDFGGFGLRAGRVERFEVWGFGVSRFGVKDLKFATQGLGGLGFGGFGVYSSGTASCMTLNML